MDCAQPLSISTLTHLELNNYYRPWEMQVTTNEDLTCPSLSHVYSLAMKLLKQPITIDTFMTPLTKIPFPRIPVERESKLQLKTKYKKDSTSISQIAAM